MRISDWSSDVCSSDLPRRTSPASSASAPRHRRPAGGPKRPHRTCRQPPWWNTTTEYDPGGPLAARERRGPHSGPRAISASIVVIPNQRATPARMANPPPRHHGIPATSPTEPPPPPTRPPPPHLLPPH